MRNNSLMRLSIAPLALAVSYTHYGAFSFTIPLSKFHNKRAIVHRNTRLYATQDATTIRRNVEIPLLDLTDSEYLDQMVQPLPSAHLPDELTTIHIYGMELTRPVHQMVVEDALERGGTFGEMSRTERVFGHIAYKPKKDSLVGAIGCTSEVILNAEALEEMKAAVEQGHAPPKTVLCRGSYRFIVKEIVKTVPFPVAIVDELIDNNDEDMAKDDDLVENSEGEIEDDEEEEDEDDEDYLYRHLSPPELVQRSLASMTTFAKQQLQFVKERDMSPLEKAIVEDSSMPDVNMNAQRQAAEETAAVVEVFQSSIADICPTPTDRYFAIAFLAAEMSNMSNEIRREILRTTNSIERLRFVLKELDHLIGMAQARKMAKAITDETDEMSKDLKVGEPEMPPWAKSIRKGMALEYYWNEEWGWCAGEVVEEPLMVVDELILTVRFNEDGSVHRLPFRPEEKVRWRPPQM